MALRALYPGLQLSRAKGRLYRDISRNTSSGTPPQIRSQRTQCEDPPQADLSGQLRQRIGMASNSIAGLLIDGFIVFLYFAVIIAIGLYKGRGSRSLESFAVG